MSFRVSRNPFFAAALSLAVTVSVVGDANAQSGTSSSGSSSKPAAGSSSKPAAGSSSRPTSGSSSRSATSGSSSRPSTGSNSRPASGSSSRSASSGSGTNHASGSGNKAVAGSGAAIDGFCTVCIVDLKKWQKGSSSFAASYDGKTYYFPGEEQRKVFLANPAKYAPALGGDCAVCLVDLGKRVPGSVQHAALSEGRLFLFPDAGTRRKFLDNPARYTNADLAFNGECSVCRVDLRKNVPGDPTFTAVHQGMRYQFMSADQQRTFVSNPTKYAVASSSAAAGGSGARTGQGSGSHASPSSGSASKPAAGSNSRTSTSSGSGTSSGSSSRSSSGSSSKPAAGSSSRSSGSSSKPAAGSSSRSSGSSSKPASGSGAK